MGDNVSHHDRWQSAHAKRTGSATAGIASAYKCPIDERICDAPSFCGKPPRACEFFGGYEHEEGVILCRQGTEFEDRGKLHEHMEWNDHE